MTEINGLPRPVFTDADIKTQILSILSSPEYALRLEHMGHDSLFNLLTACRASLAGVPGRVTAELPSKLEGRIEVYWKPRRRPAS